MAKFGFSAGSFRKAFDDDLNRMAVAATAAMTDVAAEAKRAGRANIAAAGFSAKWQNAYRANVYPAGGSSLSPAALLFHNIPYSEIFETGGTIDGKPLLWLPIDANLPFRSGGRKWTPKDFVASIGPLQLVRRSGRAPLLVATSADGAGRRGRRARSVPVFVGVPQVNLAKKFDIDAVVATAAARLPDVYAAKLKST